MARLSATSNPTNLREIARKHIGLARMEIAGKRHFQIQKFELESYNFPADAQLFLVARAGNTSRRYPAGTVTAWVRDPLDLSGLDASQVFRFRLLIRTTDSAQLIGAAENLRCVGDDDIESLIPIVPTDLGQRLWELVIDEDGPLLKVNARIFPSGPSAEAFVPFRALVLPEALRQVLEYVAADPDKLTIEGTVWADWGGWMTRFGIEQPPTEDALQKMWILEATGRFCDSFRFADDMEAFQQPGEAA